MLVERVRATIKKFRLIDKGDKILVAVSGGIDSVALLYLLNSLKKELRIVLHIAHLDHRLRRDSAKEREFVRCLGEKMGLPITTAEVEISRRGSIEQNARQARLCFLFKTAKEIGAKKIALGHNRDDQAETVLMRILRGSGLYGLSAILPKRKMQNFIIIRPLLEIGRKEIEKFLKIKKIKFCVDRSNFADIYYRNKIRNKLLPLLEKEYNPNIRQGLANMAESLACDYDYLNQAACRVIVRMQKKIELGKFLKLHPAIQRLILRLNIARLKGDTRLITYGHIKELEDLILSRPVNSVVDLPKRVSVVKKKRTILFYRREQ